MSDLSLHFSDPNGGETGQYRLMELPQELVTLVQNDAHQQFTIRGREGDDAVLCTAHKTYNIRAITISNTFYILTPPNDQEPGDAVIRDSVKQILELSPSIPKLHRLRGLLRGYEYDEDTVEDRERRMLVDIKSEIQASDAELEASLKDGHILVLGEELRPMTPSYLNTVLELLINTLVSSSFSPEAAPASDIAESLECDHEVPQNVSLQVMSWFGDLTLDSPHEKTWRVTIVNVVRQLGIGILSAHRNTPVDEDEFLTKWRTVVGDSFENRVDLSLLLGNFITSRQSSSSKPTLTYFPSSELPVLPAERFSDLFLLQTRWRAADIAPFLSDIAIDNKERDKLLMKYARSTTDKEGVVWYTTRGGTVV
ncbi:sister chromatid cohesion protein Dcc1 [Phellopilus nigrolimitatus]|nr:sister chromatid cohesion protein Dcc1 [Phellopilus nigrolimitatus]